MIALAVTLVAAAFTLVGVLLKVLINRVTPISDGASEGLADRLDGLQRALGKVRKTQGVTLRRLDAIDKKCAELAQNDDTLLEIISESREPT